MNIPILQLAKLTKHFPVRGGVFSTTRAYVQAVQEVSLSIEKGETLGLVGESGCGKSTLGRTILRLEEPTSGSIQFRGKNLTAANRHDLFKHRRNMQMIFQDPYSSLNPRMTIGDIIREPFIIHKIGTRSERDSRTIDLIERVGLEKEMLERYPHEFSGGQRQRVGIARALALEPELIVADEPVSALDVSVQAQVINLMVKLQKEQSLTYIFISHDLSVVEYISDRIAIMYLGRIVEIGKNEDIFVNPSHPYTRALLESIPIPDPRKRSGFVPVKGEAPSPINPPHGCAFHPRCPFAIPECQKIIPPLEAVKEGATQMAACIRKHEI